MATQTKSITGSTVTYTITDVEGNTVAVTSTTSTGGTTPGVLPAQGIGLTTTLSASGINGILPDGTALLSQLLLLLSTGLQP